MSEYLRTLAVTLEDLRQLAHERRLYAVLDACNAPLVQAKLNDVDISRALCLYHGSISREMKEVAPYLARVDEGLLLWLKSMVWNEPWGILIISKLEPEVVRKHLRKFLMVKDGAGDLMYFRYYDPRVLPSFLESCDQIQIDDFFGSLTAFGYAGEKRVAEGLLIQKI